MKEMTTREKTLRVKQDMAKGKFSSIEEACKHYKFAPASYYNHQKKVGDVLAEELPKTPTSAKNWIEDVEALRKENEELKRERESLRNRMFRLERKLVSVSLGEATI